MSKYIDTEKLIAEIEFAKSVYSSPNRVVHGIADAFRQDGRAAMCDDILKKIDSLQQEQQEVDLEKEFNDFLDNIEGVPRMWHSDEQIEWAKDIARHFAEWGAIHLNARK